MLVFISEASTDCVLELKSPQKLVGSVSSVLRVHGGVIQTKGSVEELWSTITVCTVTVGFQAQSGIQCNNVKCVFIYFLHKCVNGLLVGSSHYQLFPLKAE